jgi:hypothetical protein
LNADRASQLKASVELPLAYSLDWLLSTTLKLFSMGRIRQMIAVDGRKCWTLFDSGARNTYVIPSVADLLNTSTTPRTIRTALGGAVKETNTEAVLHAEIEGHPISTYALVINNIGNDEDGNPIEILFGALAMQQWGIKLDPPEEKLDLSNYPEEFVEF